MNEIEKLLRNGVSPDEILKMMNEASRKIKAEKSAENRINKLRDAAITATLNYIEASIGKPFTAEERKIAFSFFNDELKEVEKIYKEKDTRIDKANEAISKAFSNEVDDYTFNIL